MQLRPRYGTDPIIVIDGPPTGIVGPTIRQRSRLAETLASFSDDQWSHPSRCDGWSSKDVILHLASTNSFWTASIQAGLRGEPTQFLATFDPVSTPAELVAQAGTVPSSEVFERYVASSASLTETLASLSDDEMKTRAESPPGHVSINAVAHHALWDSWIHERDILLPLGVMPAVEDDEVAACLRYVAALSPAFAVVNETAVPAHLAVTSTDPDLSFVVQIGDHVAVIDGESESEFRLAGDAVNLVEGLSYRAPLATPPADSLGWMLEGLGEAFDVSAR